MVARKSLHLLVPRIVKRGSADEEIRIHGEVSRMIRKKIVLEVYVKSKEKIGIIGIDLPDGCKMIDVLIMVNKEYVGQAFSSIMDLFTSSDSYDLKWTTGFCVPSPDNDGKEYDYRDCLWEGIVSIPDGTKISEIKEMIMEINLEYNIRVIKGSSVKEVKCD